MTTGTMTDVQGVSGSELLSVVTQALDDYVRGDAVDLPSSEACAGWVLSRTSPRGGGHHCVRWTLATRDATEQAPAKCPALASYRWIFWAKRNFHPSLRDLTAICEIIAEWQNRS